MKTEAISITDPGQKTPYAAEAGSEPDEEKQPGEQEADSPDSGRKLTDDGHINSDEDLHEVEAGNVGEESAEKDKLSGPQIDLAGE